jgi:hypothetical protein
MREAIRDETNFWKPIIFRNNGVIDEQQVMKELSDFSFMLREVPIVYCEITGGQLSKPLYWAYQVLEQFHEHNLDKRITRDDVQQMIESASDFGELKKELAEYFGIARGES